MKTRHWSRKQVKECVSEARGAVGEMVWNSYLSTRQRRDIAASVVLSHVVRVERLGSLPVGAIAELWSAVEEALGL